MSLTLLTVSLCSDGLLEMKYTREDANQRLREKAMVLGGNVFLNVPYEQKDPTMATVGYIDGRSW